MLKDSSVLEYASEELKNDRYFIFAALSRSHYGYALEFTSEELKNDSEIVLAAVSKNGIIWLKNMPPPRNWRTNREIILAAESKSGYALQYVSKELFAPPVTIGDLLDTWYHLEPPNPLVNIHNTTPEYSFYFERINFTFYTFFNLAYVNIIYI